MKIQQVSFFNFKEQCMSKVIKYYKEYGINWIWLYPVNGDEHFRIHKGNTREEVDNAYYKYFQYASSDKKYDPRVGAS